MEEARKDKLDWCKSHTIESLEYGHSIPDCLAGFLNDLQKTDLWDEAMEIVFKSTPSLDFTNMSREEFINFINGFN